MANSDGTFMVFVTNISRTYSSCLAKKKICVRVSTLENTLQRFELTQSSFVGLYEKIIYYDFIAYFETLLVDCQDRPEVFC